MSNELPADVIESARSVDLVQLVESYGIQMHKQGKDYFGLCCFHSEDTPSFTIYRKGNQQRYHCMGCGADGDAIQFVRDYEGLKFRDAVKRITGELPASGNVPTPAPASVPAEPEEVWTPIIPIPDNVPMVPDLIRRKVKGQWISVQASRRWDYFTADGEPMGYVFRYDMPSGGKEVVPTVWAVSSLTGECQWRNQAFPKPRPIYGLERLAANPAAQVMVVEGEKACDAARQLLLDRGFDESRVVVVSWPGGGKAVKHVDWSPLGGRAIALWPDADKQVYPDRHEKAGIVMPFTEQPGTVAMFDVWSAVRSIAMRVRLIQPPEDVEDGWDLADELPEGFSLIEHIRTSSEDMVRFVPSRSSETAEDSFAEKVDGVEEITYSKHVWEIVDALQVRLMTTLRINPADVVTIRKLGIDVEIIARMIDGSFWSGSKSKLFLLDEAQCLIQFIAGDAYKFLVRRYGSPIDDRAIARLTESTISALGFNKTQSKEFRQAVESAVPEIIIDHLKHHNQRESVEWRCDMFATEARLELLEDKVRIILAHKPFVVCGTYEKDIIDDYKSHFSRLDEFLEFLVQSRFALDRKKCYLWLLADSDWGKGFLLGVLSALRISVSTSMKEIEAMFEGRPVGRVPEDFKRAFVLVVDEFKTVKSELKQLQSEITLSPKNQLSASVEVFAKLFLSAESVASLVTENGVEDQFANRMSIFQERGSLVKRPLYTKVGNPRYFSSVLSYFAETMNGMVERMQTMGRLEAQTYAESWINNFISKYGIDTVFDRFSDSLPNVALDAVEWFHRRHLRQTNILEIDRLTNNYFLINANKSLNDFLNEKFDPSEVYAYRKRKPEILRHMSVDGKGIYPHKINGLQRKSVMLKKMAA